MKQEKSVTDDMKPTQKALYNLVGLFITGPLTKERNRPEVRQALAVLAQMAKKKLERYSTAQSSGGREHKPASVPHA